MSKNEFYEALEKNDKEKLKKIEKSDLHNHSARGANRKYFEKKYSVKFPDVPLMHSIEEMDNWYDSNIGMYCDGSNGFKERIKSLFIQANEDNIKVIVAWGISEELENLIKIAITKPQLNKRIGLCKGKGNIYYYHPCPRVVEDRKKWLEDINKII